MKPFPLIFKEDFAPYIELTQNLDPARINAYIVNFQEIHLREILGAALYEDFVEKLKASRLVVNPVALTDAYALLLDRLVPYLVFGSYAEYIPFSQVRTTNTGLVRKQHEQSEALDNEQIMRLVENSNRQAENYRSLLVDFLKQKASDYPLYPKPDSCSEISQNGSRTIALGFKKSCFFSDSQDF